MYLRLNKLVSSAKKSNDELTDDICQYWYDTVFDREPRPIERVLEMTKHGAVRQRKGKVFGSGDGSNSQISSIKAPPLPSLQLFEQ